MNKAITILLASTMFASVPALAFNPVEWMLKNAVENAAQDAATDALRDALLGSAKKSASAPNGKAKKPEEVEVSIATENDYRALPLTGDFRFSMPEGVALDALAVGPRGGYIDRFENEWVPVKGKRGVVRWLEHLSERGRLRMIHFTQTSDYLVVGRDGERIMPEKSG